MMEDLKGKINQLIIDHLQDHGVFMMDTNGTILSWNPGIERILGYREEEFTGKNFNILYTVEDKNTNVPDEELKTALEKGACSSQAWLVRKSGSAFFAEGTTSSVRDANGSTSGFVKIFRDQTGSKLAAEELKKSEEKYKMLIQNSSDILTIFDRMGTIVYQSPAVEKILGYTQQERIGQNIFEGSIAHPDDRRTQQEMLEKALKNPGETIKAHFRLRTKSGEYRNIEALSTCSHNHPGDPQIICSYRDVSEHVEAKEALKRQHELTDLITKNASLGLFMMDDQQRCTYMNPAAEKITGFTFKEVRAANKPLHYIIHHKKPDGSFYPLEECPIDRALPTQNNTRGEDVFVRPDGSLYPVAFTASPILDKGIPVGTVIEVQDITVQKETMQKLHQREEEFRTLANNVHNLVWMAHPDGAIYWFNKQWYDYTGTNPEESEGCKWTSLMHPDQKNEVVERLKESWTTGMPFEHTFQLRKKDGSYHWFLTRVVPLKNADGSMIKWIGTSTDIDEQKAFEKKLAAQVTERTRELQQSNEDLQQFAHVTSHDLKEPVRKIRTFIDMLLKEYGSEVSAESRFYLDKISEAADRVRYMVDGVLTYSSVGATKRKTESVDLNELIRKVQLDLELLISQKSAKIHSETLPVIQGAGVLLHQLFYNLINNALKFSKPGVPPEVRITVKPEDMRGRKYFRIEVSDNGIGFESDESSNIFKTFVRLHSKDKYEGTGLGLALCKKIVSRHEGEITAKGELNKGAIFLITLPSVQLKEVI